MLDVSQSVPSFEVVLVEELVSNLVQLLLLQEVLILLSILTILNLSLEMYAIIVDYQIDKKVSLHRWEETGGNA